MNFYNINNSSEKVSLKEAVLKSVTRVSDLYMPEYIPLLSPAFYDKLNEMSLHEIAFKVSKAMFGQDIPDDALEYIVNKALNFEIPLRKLDENLYVLELFHGPTLAFKDVGARYMACLVEYLLQNENREITILVATSGDTGSAVANAFLNSSRIKVVILYPSGRVSEIQEKQLTTMDGNITSFDVDGDFDDCQRLVKLAFSDAELNTRLNLTSANSINFARLFPQSFYYFYALAQLPRKDKPVVISVPSGNFGNLTAGLIARKMGLPVDNFIAATNVNRAVPEYLINGRFKPQPTIHTITNAMDVGNPSNFPRVIELFNKRHREVSSAIKGYWFTDEETCKSMNELQNSYAYQADPHGAVAYLGLKKYQVKRCCTGIFLETAHPAKFPVEVERATNKKVQIPDTLKDLMVLENKSVKIPNSFAYLKSLLIQSYGNQVNAGKEE
jgi:threonine synthase